MPSQTEDQRQNWQTSKARSRWAESLLRRAQNQITIESDAVANIQTAINAAQTDMRLWAALDERGIEPPLDVFDSDLWREQSIDLLMADLFFK